MFNISEVVKDFLTGIKVIFALLISTVLVVLTAPYSIYLICILAFCAIAIFLGACLHFPKL